MNVVAADWLPYALPLKRPWQTSRGQLLERRGKLLRLRNDQGLTGWGDCAPLPEFGIDEPAARAFAEESAHLDLAAQSASLPLHAWLSGEPNVASLAVNSNLGAISELSEAALQASLDAGFQVLKIKVGLAAPAEEIARLRQLATGLPAPIKLRLDANAAWSLPEARQFLDACRSLPIEGLEEPLRYPVPEELAQLQAGLPFPLALDESCHLLTPAFFRHPPLRRLVLKPARHGGLLKSMEIALRARAAGLECIVTSSLESSCGLLACAQLAAAIAPDSVHGLGTAEWLAADTGWTAPISGGRLYLPESNGLGFVIAEDWAKAQDPD
ncbi:o-succinylbenzoate synthase [Dechloromonas hortensis]|uniref:o-succinylbenzoate synthase n=1 Tax=Dechloromonas hortensis TaxID=337779 RepID=UPI001478F945|nr:o-succinylbenzoate synthase [Dechloromonas hortensis]